MQRLHRHGQTDIQWGIVCPANCKCRRKGLDETVEKARILHNEIQKDLTFEFLPDIEIVPRLNKRLEYNEQLESPLDNLVESLLAGFKIGVMRFYTIPAAIRYITRLINIFELIYPPDSTDLAQWKEWRDNPETHSYFGIREGTDDTDYNNNDVEEDFED